MEVINEQKRNYENDSIDELIHPVGYSSCQTLSIVAYVNAQSFIVSLLAFDIRNDQVIIITHYCFLTRGFLIKRNENETANRLFISRDTQGQIHIEYKKEDKLVETIQSVRTQVEQYGPYTAIDGYFTTILGAKFCHTVLTSFTVDKQTVNESVLINLGSNKYKIQYSYSNKLQTTAIDLGNYFNNEGKLDVDNNQLMKRISKSVSNILQHRSGYVSSRSHSTIADPDSARASSTYRPVQATRVQRH
ncbi:unnamed protein product [Rotaria socialis]